MITKKIKSEWRKDGMKQIIHTGHKEFDNYIVAICTGNVIGGGQTSFYIRPYNETECNGFTWEKGHLRKHDLDQFSNMDSRVRKYVESITLDQSIILYEFYHYNRNYGQGRKYTRQGHERWQTKFITHGYVITTGNHELVQFFVTGPTMKSEQVIMGVLPYIVKENTDTTGKGRYLNLWG